MLLILAKAANFKHGKDVICCMFKMVVVVGGQGGGVLHESNDIHIIHRREKGG